MYVVHEKEREREGGAHGEKIMQGLIHFRPARVHAFLSAV